MDVKAMLWAAAALNLIWCLVGTYVWFQGVKVGVDVRRLQILLSTGFALFAALTLFAAGWPSI